MPVGNSPSHLVTAAVTLLVPAINAATEIAIDKKSRLIISCVGFIFADSFSFGRLAFLHFDTTRRFGLVRAKGCSLKRRLPQQTCHAPGGTINEPNLLIKEKSRTKEVKAEENTPREG